MAQEIVRDKSAEPTIDEQLADEIAKFYADPLGYVIFNFPWGDETYGLASVKLPEPWRSRYNSEYGPDKWACEFLDEVGKEVRKRNFNGKKAVAPIQFATASGHGIGKSTLTSWLILWIMDTRPGCKGTVTATTADQLKTKTWAEVGKWLKLGLTGHLYTYTNTRGAMSLKRKGEETTWFCNAVTCKEENSEAFAGQHAVSATSFYIFDEASGVPDKIYEVREGGLTDGEPMAFDFGNPTRNSGRFYENCKGRFASAYHVREIDSRSVQITNKELFDKWIDLYGEDSDFVRVRVKGQFPKQGTLQFISTEAVDLAMRRDVVFDRNAQMVIGVDAARFGDDESVIYPRLGWDARTYGFERYSKLDGVQLAGRVIAKVQFFRSLGINVHSIFVDVTGGAGASCYDQLYHLSYPVIAVSFAGKASKERDYYMKSDELWGNMKEGLDRLVLPMPHEEGAADLRQQLISREFGYTRLGAKQHLESKEDLKKRGLPSPDIADALACTFAMQVAPANLEGMMNAHPGVPRTYVHDYDPLTL